MSSNGCMNLFGVLEDPAKASVLVSCRRARLFPYRALVLYRLLRRTLGTSRRLRHRSLVRARNVLHVALLAVLRIVSPGPLLLNLSFSGPYSHPSPEPIAPKKYHLTSHLANLNSDSPLLSATIRLSSLSERRTTREATAM